MPIVVGAGVDDQRRTPIDPSRPKSHVCDQVPESRYRPAIADCRSNPLHLPRIVCYLELVAQCSRGAVSMGRELSLFAGTFTTLLAIINPLEVLPVYLKLLAGKDETTHRAVAWKACLYSLLLCFFFFIFGTLILRLFGVPLRYGPRRWRNHFDEDRVRVVHAQKVGRRLGPVQRERETPTSHLFLWRCRSCSVRARSPRSSA